MESMTRICTCGATLLAFGALLGACDSSNSPAMPDSNPHRAVDSQIPSLGAAEPFAVFGGGAGITNQGVHSVINGSIGTTGASTAITGFHSASFKYSETPLNVGTVNGLVFTNAPQGVPADFAFAKHVAADALYAYDRLAAIPGGIDPDTGRLGGLTLAPGVYKSATGSFDLVGADLTLDGNGDPDAVWVFQMAGRLTVGGPSASRKVILLDGARPKNVYWQVGNSAAINLAGGGSMAGTILAKFGATFSSPGNTVVTVLNGRALGLYASVDLVNTVVNAPGRPVLVMPAKIVASPIVHGGAHGADVAEVPGEGFLGSVDKGAHVSATEVGSGSIRRVLMH